jgi:putative ABC transport system permease protein
LALAWYGLDLLVTFTARFTTRASEISIDGTVLAFTLAVSVGIGILFGMIPAFRSRTNLAADLNEGGSRSSAGTGSHRLRSLLVVAQVAVSLMLLIGAGLMVRSLIQLQQVDPGVNTERVLTMFVDLNWSKHPGTDLQTRRDFHHALLERVRALPGVISADLSQTFPLNSAGTFALNFQIEGRPIEEGQPLPRFDFRVAGPDYFRTVGIPLVQGRLFERGDDAEAPLVVLVNQSLARRHFGEDSPIGQNISYDNGQTWRRIVGVVGNVKQNGLDQDVPDEIYMPNDQVPLRSMNLLVKTQADPMGLARAATEAVYAIDPEQPVARIATMEEVRRTSLAPARLTTALIGLFALLALVITAAGIGGVMALMVSQRIHEIGIRMALGATPGEILRMVVGQGLALVGIGLVLGIVGAFALTRFVSGLLFQTEPTDPVTFVAVPVVLLLVAASACLVPARRATRVDPLVALRYE